jgi:predicted DNA-binding WGR domain protein
MRKQTIKLTQSEIRLLKSIQSLNKKLDGVRVIPIPPRKKSPRLLKKVTLENNNYPHYKEWVAEIYSNDDVIARWGRIGARLQSKKFNKAGKAFFWNKVYEKLNKGYRYSY